MTAILSPYSKEKFKRGRGFSSPSFYLKYFLFLIIFLLLVQITYGYILPKENFLIDFNVSSNFLNLQNLISYSQNIFEPSILNKTFYFFLTDKKLEIKLKDWEISGFYYSEYICEINKSTLNFLQKVINKESIPIGENYNISANLEGYSVIGGMLSKKLNLKKINISLNFKILYGLDLQKGELYGNFSRLDEESYQFNLNLDYLYNKNLLYKRKDLISGRGFGTSFDLDLSLNLSENFSISVFIRDLYGKIFWETIPFVVANANSEREYYDEYGNIVFRPLISGYEGYKDFTTKIPMKTKISLRYIDYPILFNLNFSIINLFYIYELEIAYLLSKDNTSYMLKSPFNLSWRNYFDSFRFIIFGDKNNVINVFFNFSQKI